MTRIEEAKKLHKQGLTFQQIAEKMNIKVASVQCYIYASSPDPSWRCRTRFSAKVRDTIHEELASLGLPSEWEDELVKMFSVYHYCRRTRGLDIKVDIRSLIQLLCRRYRVPTPRKLEVLTYQGRGSKKQVSGYMDALKVMDGVEPSKPIDYVKYFVEVEKLSEEELKEAEELIKKIPQGYRQGMNPRVLAGAVLYEMHKPMVQGSQKERIYTQRYIADKLQVTPASVRNEWVRFFKSLNSHFISVDQI